MKLVSTTELGDAFRDDVAALLRAAGYKVQSEVRVGSKKADVYYEYSVRGKTWRIAVETKFYKDAMTRSKLSAIFNDYSEAFEDNDIDELMIVSLKPIVSADANGFINRRRQLSHRTFSELQSELMDFNNVLANFRDRHEQDGLEKYYVRPRAISGEDIVEIIDRWLSNDDPNPIAIIAGYGMGKTSLAKHLTYRLASAIAGGDHNARIPVLVNMGGLSREQGVEGLIGTSLSGSEPAVRGYAYPLFHLLNRAGRFVVILDGFDEMKHMMSEGEFRTTFQEMSRLCDGKAKVMILGRPTAFLSENENARVLRGIRVVGKQTTKLPNSPTYTELRIESFTPEEVRTFLSGYFALHHDEEFSRRRLRELESRNNDELLSRPVHAKMFAELAADPAFVIDQLTRFDLYDHFVEMLIDREQEKLGRGRLLTGVDRRAFSCDIAWHLWIQPTGAALGCRVEDIPAEVFQPYIPAGEDPLSARRALLSGSFLDEKSGGVFFFAHRSFQEFLVAEYIFNFVTDSAEGRGIIDVIGTALTKEVYDFLKERNDREFFEQLLSLLNNTKASVPLEVYFTLLSSRQLGRAAAKRTGPAFSAWAASLWIGRLILYDDIAEKDVIPAVISMTARASKRPGVLLAALRALLLLAPSSLLKTEQIARCAIILMYARAQQDIDALLTDTEARRRGKGVVLRDAIFEAVTAELTKGGDLRMELNTLEAFLAVDGAQHPIEASASEAVRFVYRGSFDEFFGHLPEPAKKRILEFYRTDALANRYVSGHPEEQGDTAPRAPVEPWFEESDDD